MGWQPSGCRPPRSAVATVGQVKRVRPLDRSSWPCAVKQGSTCVPQKGSGGA